MGAEVDRWRVVLERGAAQRPFVYAVVTTGVYCRPQCPSRRPLRRNVLFFDNPVEAEVAGFRACPALPASWGGGAGG